MSARDGIGKCAEISARLSLETETAGSNKPPTLRACVCFWDVENGQTLEGAARRTHMENRVFTSTALGPPQDPAVAQPPIAKIQKMMTREQQQMGGGGGTGAAARSASPGYHHDPLLQQQQQQTLLHHQQTIARQQTSALKRSIRKAKMLEKQHRVASNNRSASSNRSPKVATTKPSSAAATAAAAVVVQSQGMDSSAPTHKLSSSAGAITLVPGGGEGVKLNGVTMTANSWTAHHHRTLPGSSNSPQFEQGNREKSSLLKPNSSPGSLPFHFPQDCRMPFMKNVFMKKHCIIPSFLRMYAHRVKRDDVASCGIKRDDMGSCGISRFQNICHHPPIKVLAVGR